MCTLLLPTIIYSPPDFSLDNQSSSSWYPDSGATNHVSHDMSNLQSGSEYLGGKKLHLGNGPKVDISHVGHSVLYSSPPNTISKSLILKDLLHVPSITKNLLSVSQFAKDNDVFFEFHPLSCFVKDQSTKQVILKGILDQGLYRFTLHKPPQPLHSHSKSTISNAFNKSSSGLPTVLICSSFYFQQSFSCF